MVEQFTNGQNALSLTELHMEVKSSLDNNLSIKRVGN